MKSIYALVLLIVIASITACSPHPASGVWQTTDLNDYGITKMIVAFDGKANLTTDNATWRCFWSAKTKTEMSLECTPSSNPDNEQIFIMLVKEPGVAELRKGSESIASFIRLDENRQIKE